jgi:hypothetical protein
MWCELDEKSYIYPTHTPHIDKAKKNNLEHPKWFKTMTREDEEHKNKN